MEANEENGCGWVIKGPFTTNSQCIKFVHSIDEMKDSMRILSEKYFGNLPYLMIQPCMYNRKECKVVVLNNTPVFRAAISTGSHNKSKNGINKKFAEEIELLQFAQTALERFRAAAPFAITDGLFRVDIFQTISGKMVVNEFESLDAEYQSTTSGTNEATYSFLERFWFQKLKEYIL